MLKKARARQIITEQWNVVPTFLRLYLDILRKKRRLLFYGKINKILGGEIGAIDYRKSTLNYNQGMV